MPCYSSFALELHGKHGYHAIIIFLLTANEMLINVLFQESDNAAHVHTIWQLVCTITALHKDYCTNPLCAETEIYCSVLVSLCPLQSLCSWLTKKEPNKVFCCCSSSVSRFDVLCVPRCFSAHYIVQSFCQFKLVWPFSADLLHRQSVTIWRSMYIQIL